MVDGDESGFEEVIKVTAVAIRADANLEMSYDGRHLSDPVAPSETEGWIAAARARRVYLSVQDLSGEWY